MRNAAAAAAATEQWAEHDASGHAAAATAAAAAAATCPCQGMHKMATKMKKKFNEILKKKLFKALEKNVLRFTRRRVTDAGNAEQRQRRDKNEIFPQFLYMQDEGKGEKITCKNRIN